LSDLAISCEYLTNEKLCSAVSENDKAKAARQVRCENDEKMTCCYLCTFKVKCAIGCSFLGNIGNESQQIGAEKSESDNAQIKDEKSELDQTKNAPIISCSLCNIKMCQAKTKIRINGWTGLHQKAADGRSEKIGEELLPVIVYLCPKCGKIEFGAEEATKQKLLFLFSRSLL